MIIIFESNPEIGAHVRSKLCYLIGSRHLLRSRAVTNQIFFSLKRTNFLHACAAFYKLPSNIITIVYPAININGPEILAKEEANEQELFFIFTFLSS